MGTRISLHALLCDILGSNYVYFQPPETIKLTYPCIIYNLSDARTRFADDKPYNYLKKYTITVIDKDPDSTIPDEISMLPRCVFDRFYTADNLNHFTFNIMY